MERERKSDKERKVLKTDSTVSLGNCFLNVTQAHRSTFQPEQTMCSFFMDETTAKHTINLHVNALAHFRIRVQMNNFFAANKWRWRWSMPLLEQMREFCVGICYSTIECEKNETDLRSWHGNGTNGSKKLRR